MKKSTGLVQVFRHIASHLTRRLLTEVKNDLVSENVRTRRDNPDVQFPPSALSIAAYNHSNYRRYLETGREHAKFVMQTIRKFSSSRDLAVCEWGCGPARIIQHLSSLGGGIARLIGTDCHQETIEWCRDSFSNIEFMAHDLNPPLALSPGSLDVIYCCAVFTHLDEPLHHAWINEILRLLRPGGLLIASFHGERLEDRMNGNELSAYRDGSLVVRHEGREGERTFVSFAGDRFVRERLLYRFDNITRLDDAPFLQTVWSATAPAT